MNAPTGLRNWLRWEFGRSIDVTQVIRLITIERFVKATVLIIGGISLAVLSTEGDISRWASVLQDQLNLNPGHGFFTRLWEKIVVSFGSLSVRKQDAIAAGAILYGTLEGFEGVGLLLRRRWAEYLVLVATVVFLPLEIGELIRHATLFKGAALLVNIAIVIYLVWRKRLFLERPGSHVIADDKEGIA